MPPDLAEKIGVSGVNEVLDVLWKGYFSLKNDLSIAIDEKTDEDYITQKWFEKIQKIWDSRNRTTSVVLNDLIPIHQYADNTMKRTGGNAPTIDFCFKDWTTDNSYFGAEAKNLYKNRQNKIRRYVDTGVQNFVNSRYGSQSSESSVIGYILSGTIPDIVDELRKEIQKGAPITNLTRATAKKEPQYWSEHTRAADKKAITLHHLFFDFTA